METLAEQRARREQLAAFLRARRREIDPATIGIPVGGRRPAHGLRREEVAYLSGISVKWYANIEQARDVRPTADVLEAVGRALRLGVDERAYVLRLGGFVVDEEDDVDTATDECALLCSLVDDLLPLPARVSNRFRDLITCNEAYVRLFGFDPRLLPPERRNSFLFAFVESFPSSPDRDMVLRRFVADLRFQIAIDPSDARGQALVSELSEASAEFRALWSDQRVTRRPFTGGIIRARPEGVGEIAVQSVEMSMGPTSSYRLFIGKPVTSEDRDRLERLLTDVHLPSG